jgi:prepilin-type N-terminal cleavage/methylation domain-containing protein
LPRPRRTQLAHLRRGITLVEIVVVVAIIGVLGLITMPMMTEYSGNMTLRSTARSVADIFLLARAEAIRTGDHHVVFFGNTDEGGNPLQDPAGDWVPMLALDDGAPTASNCVIEGGENTEVVLPVDGVSWGLSFATGPAPDDEGTEPFNQANGNSFRLGATSVDWVLFQPDGIPVLGTGGTDCGTLSGLGTGGGAIYITNGERDYGIVLTPLGSVRVHSWDRNNDGWSS